MNRPLMRSLVLQHVGEIRDDQIDAEHIRIREDEAAIDQDHIAPGTHTG